MKTIKEELAAAWKTLESVPVYNNRDTRGLMFYVSAKMNIPRYDIEDIIKKVSDNIAIQEYLNEVCDENWDYNIYNRYIENEAEYAREWLDGVAYNNDEIEYKKLLLIKSKHAGFYGRSGGQFCFAEYNEAEDILNQAEDAIKYAEENEKEEAKKEAAEYLKQFYSFMDAITWAISQLEEMKKGIEKNYPEELFYRIEEEKENFLNESK